MSDQLDTKTGWLSRDQLENIRANVPLVYVDAVPVRVDEVGRVTKVGMLLRQAADGSISRMVVSGRVLYGERVRDALLRHLFVEKERPLFRKDLSHFENLCFLFNGFVGAVHAEIEVFPQAGRGRDLLPRDRGIGLVHLGIEFPGHRLGDIQLGRKEPVDITRRHAAILGNLGHRCLAVSVVLDPLHGGFKNLLAGIGCLVHGVAPYS